MQFSASQIASLVNGEVDGDAQVMVNTFAKIEEGHKGAISFLANPKYTHHIYNTESSIVLVKRDFKPEHDIKSTLIRVDDPYATLALLLDLVNQMLNPQPQGVETPSFVSEGVELPKGIYLGAFAYVGKNVKLGKNVKIYPQVYIGNNVEIGDDTILYPGVKIYHNCKIGKKCILQAGVVVGGDGFGFAPVSSGYNKIPQIGNVVIEDDVEIGANTTIDRATMGSTFIRKGVKLDNLIQVAHNVEIGENTVMAAQVGIAGSTKIGANCMVGGQAGFAGHITIGDNVQVGAQTGIPSNVSSNCRIMGYPATDVREFAKQAVYIKNLGKLNDRIKEIEKKIENNQ